MGEHVPKLHKALIALFVGLAIILSGAIDARFVHSWYTVVALIFGVGAGLFGVTEMYLLLGQDKRATIYEHRQLAETLNKADAETRRVFGQMVPRYNYRWDGQQTYTAWQDTTIPRDVFWEFVRESTERNTVAQRAWQAKGQVPGYTKLSYHESWIEIYETLVEFGLVIESSHTGPYSEFWAGDGYDRACDYWPRRIPELE